MRRQAASQRAFHRVLGSASPGASVVDLLDDVQATIVPAAPTLPLVNNVFAPSPDALSAALPELRSLYRAAGVSRWGTWVEGGDLTSLQRVRRAGFQRRTVLTVMGGALPERCAPPGATGDVTLDAAPTAEAVGRCIDEAFGVRAPGTVASALQRHRPGQLFAYVARRGGKPACGMLVSHHEGNAYTWGLAATPAARGTLAAYRLLRMAVAEAIAAGCTTLTCETTPAAEAIARSLRLRRVGRHAFMEWSAEGARSR